MDTLKTTSDDETGKSDETNSPELKRLRRQVAELEQRCQTLQNALDQARSGRPALPEVDYATLVENAPVTICRFDRQLRYVYVNPIVESNTGIPAAYFLGKTSREAGMDEKYIPAFEAAIQKVFATREKVIVEIGYPTPDGEVNYYQTVYVPEYSADGKQVEYVLAISNNVTELRRTASALAKSESAYRAILDNMADAVTRYDRDLRIDYVNPVITRNRDVAAEYYLGHKVAEFGSAEQFTLWETAIKAVFETAQPRTIEYSTLIKGELRYFQSQIIPQIENYDEPTNRKISHVLSVSRDITDLKQSQLALARSEQRYRTLVESSPDTISLYDRQLRHVYISPSVEQRSGLSADFYIGKTAQELNMPEVLRVEWEAIAKKVFETGQPQLYEFKSWLGAQGERYSQILLVPQYNETGEAIEYILGINRDITALKAAQNTLIERERQYRTLVENSPDIITRYDRDLRVLFVNSAVEHSLGRPAESFVGKTLYELAIPEDQIQAVQSVFESGEVTTYDYTAGSGLKNEQRHYQARLIPEFDPQFSAGSAERPPVVSVVTITTDVTALDQSQQALAAEKERLTVTLRSIGEAVVATDTTGQITLFNARAETLTGWNASQALGQPFDAVINLFDYNTNAAVSDLTGEVLNSGDTIRLGSAPGDQLMLLPRQISTEDDPNLRGTLIEGRVSPLYQPEGTGSQAGRALGIVFVFEDVTRKRRLEEELQKADKLQAIGVLAGGIAHDFNNFLAAILGNLAFIRRGLGEDHPLYKNLREAEGACLSARGLTQQLLTFARGGTPVKKETEIGEMLAETTNFVLRGTNTRGQIEIAPDLWPAPLDSGQISQVIHNLVLNAQQAMPEGGLVRVRASNRQISRAEELPHQSLGQVVPIKPGSYLLIEVIDQGIGIPAKYLSSIFDPYFTTKQKGNGLGLSVCYSIIKNHDGYITVESQPGVGTTFQIYLPATPPVVVIKPAQTEQPAINQQKANEATVNTTANRPLRVLVMDDQEMILELVSDVLGDSGHTVDGSQSGEEAIALYRQALEENQPYDVVIMDLTIPGGMGGKEAISHLRQLDPAVRAIVSSGYSNDPITSNYRDYGFSAVLPKPFDIEELVATVEKVAAK